LTGIFDSGLLACIFAFIPLICVCIIRGRAVIADVSKWLDLLLAELEESRRARIQEDHGSDLSAGWVETLPNLVLVLACSRVHDNMKVQLTDLRGQVGILDKRMGKS
jgi:hypothetical protein